jgi:hypothetical protein
MKGRKTVPASTKTAVQIDLKLAEDAIRKYNSSKYGSRTNPEIDQEAIDTFARGLGSSYHEIFFQVAFIGWDYGGFPDDCRRRTDALAVPRRIARYIHDYREEYEKAATEASSILDPLDETAILNTVETLYKPFVQTVISINRERENWPVWAAKFWHRLNHDAFPIRDSRADDFLRVKGKSYLNFLVKFRDFVLPRQVWLPVLEQVDRATCVIGRACCHNKLWDKVLYSFWDL